MGADAVVVGETLSALTVSISASDLVGTARLTRSTGTVLTLEETGGAHADTETIVVRVGTADDGRSGRYAC